MHAGVRRKVAAVLLWAGLCALAAAAEPFDHAHTLYDGVLRRVVRDGLVDYRALKADPQDLKRYLDTLAEVAEGEFGSWTVPQRLAYLINLYNAQTLQLVVDHYPVRSIKRTAGWFGDPWKLSIVRLFGNRVTLDIVEHNLIRRHYAEPAVHFALVRGTRGSPPLRGEAYVPDRLYDQLLDQGRAFLASPPRNRIDAGKRRLYLSPVFKWYADDFTRKAGSVQAYVRIYFPEEVAAVMQRGGFSIRYTDYDWSLNDLALDRR